jgi:hypothetical protein
MAQSCDFKTTEDSTKSWFRTNGLIDKSLNILNLREFRKKNVEFSRKAKEDYKVEGRLFLEKDSGKVAVPNTAVFKTIDKAKNPIQVVPNIDDKRGEASVDSSARQRLFNGKDKKTAAEVLTTIITTNPNPSIKKTAEFLLENLPADLNTTVNLLPVSVIEAEVTSGAKFVRGIYDPLTQNIDMAEFARFPRGQIDVTIIHEIVHALTWRQVRQKGKLSDDLEDLYNHAKSIVKEKHYGLSTSDEFLAEVFSNSAFIRTLTKYPASPKRGNYANLLEEIVAWIKSVLQVHNTDTLYEEAIAIATNIVKENFDYMKENPNFDMFSMQEDTESSWEEFQSFGNLSDQETFYTKEGLYQNGSIEEYTQYREISQSKEPVGSEQDVEDFQKYLERVDIDAKFDFNIKCL